MPGRRAPLPLIRTLRLAVVLGLLGALAACARGGAAPDASAPPADTVVATVNGQPILKADLDRQMNELISSQLGEFSSERIRLIRPRIRKAALDTLINQALLAQEIKKRGIAVSDAEIDHEIEVLRGYYAAFGATLARRMESAGLTTATLRAEIHDRLAHNKAVDALLGLAPPSEAEVERFYREHPERYTSPRAAHVQLIEVTFPQNAPPPDQTRTRDYLRAEEAYQHLLADEPFAGVARRFSTGPSAARGGDIGWINDEVSLPASVVDAAFTLPIGGLSKILSTANGFYIVKVLARRDEALEPLDQVRPIVAYDVRLLDRLQREPALMERLRAEANVKLK